MKKQILSAFLAITLAVTGIGASSISAAAAGGSSGKGKYISEVYFAYAKTEEEAVKWLTENGYEPIKGNNDFNAGKTSVFDTNTAVAMGIKRTDKVDEAITDMAVINMTGGYNYPDYETLLKEKKAEIEEFVNSFLPVLAEYRTNCSGAGSESGKARAALAREALNRFFDGNPNDPYGKNDTGKNLGDLFVEPSRQEGNASGGDLQQIFLESSGPAALAVETLLVLGADANDDTWLERLSGLSGDGLVENLSKYVPEAAGQNVSPSAAMQYLNQRYGDAAKTMQDQWNLINEELVWFRDYSKQNDLFQHKDESQEAYGTRIDKYFKDLETKEKARYNDEYNRYLSNAVLYQNLQDVSYKGDWGETLSDFFDPADGVDVSGNAENFLPLAAALSPGQRAALNIVNLRTLLFIGSVNAEGINYVKPDLEELAKDRQEFSVYTGVNRLIFRGSAALTNRALMDQNMGNGAAFDEMWNNTGIVAICSFAAAGVGLVTLIAGSLMKKAGRDTELISKLSYEVNQNKRLAENPMGYLSKEEIAEINQTAKQKQTELNAAQNGGKGPVHTAGRWMMGIGGALMIGAAFVKGYQMYKYYDKEFTKIPLLIVDEADIVSYTKDKNGRDVRQVNFSSYAFYEAAKCNRQIRGKQKDWQGGVDKYVAWGCGDLVDLNADYGKEWLALYTVKNPLNGNPILADSLTLQYGSDTMPKGCTKALHFFAYSNAVKLDDTTYCYDDAKKGVYFFWDSDAKAVVSKTATSFGAGQMALAGAGGLLLGALAATLVLTSRKKKKEEQAA